MEENWKSRLLKAVDEDPRSDRAISLATGLGVNTVNELRNTDKSPSIEKVMKLSEELGVSLAYLFWGAEDDKAPIRGEHEIRAMLGRVQGLKPDDVGLVLGMILNTIKANAYEQEHSRIDDQSETANPHREPTP
ncbi:helix-turn-helix domain-containing protein [Brucella anthropi]|uniref:helix-turn-helix domain-containing protein n=1 Tax=Brucella anthropi TaxID=529 RepID=UPI0002887763|nr:helix-turn-helix transcriptional regulator [Brucella anthropi]